MRILVINGPNLNLLGSREPQIYGGGNYQELLLLIQQCCAARGVDCGCFQSNHEGGIIDAIQGAVGRYDGIVINPAAYTHTSIAIADALRGVGLPAVEVHLSDITQREPYRRISYTADVCIGQIKGHGFAGYREAIELLIDYLQCAEQERQ
ncbi:MAG: type II 3-dehydroquinate dehydratase [Clostridiales bacterium]